MKLALPIICLVACTTEENLGTTVDATPRWAITLGQRGYEQATAVAVDSHGDVLVAGTGSLAAADFGTGTIGDASVHWAFLAKRSGVDGSPIWTIPFAGSGDGNVTALAVTSNDSVVVTGSRGGTALGIDDADAGMFVAEYSATGALAWVQNVPGGDGVSVAVDASGNIFAAGTFDRSVTFMGATHTAPANEHALGMFGFAADGTPKWGTFFDGYDGARISGLSTSPTGDIVLAGSFNDVFAVGGELMDASARMRGFVARYHGDGSLVWSEPIGAIGGDEITYVSGVRVDAFDRIALLADAGNTFVAGQTSPTLISFGPEGGQAWKYTHTTASSTPSGGIAVRGDGSIVSAVWNCDYPVDPEGDRLELRFFDAGGAMAVAHVGDRITRTGNNTFVHAAAVGPAGQLVVVGQLAGEVMIGDSPIEAHGTDDTDAFIVAFDSP